MADGEVKAQDLAQETASTLSGNEQFVMFDNTAGKRADIDDVATYVAGDKTTLKTTNKTSPVAAINENFDAIADVKEDFSDYEDGSIHIPASKYSRGILNADGTISNTQTYYATNNEDIKYDYPVKITAKSGYKFIYQYQASSGYVSGTSWETSQFVPANTPFRLRVGRVTETWSAADLSLFSKQINIISKDRAETTFNSSKIEKLKSGDEFLNASFNRGTLQSGAYVYVTYRIYSIPVIRYNRAITISAETGFRFAIHTFDSNDTFISDLGWFTTKKINANQGFKIIIARSTDNTSEMADVYDFYTKVTIQTTMRAYIDDVSGVDNLLASPMMCNGKSKLAAHMGYHVSAPPNTIPAYKAAGKLGYWGIESDLQQTSDGYYVMCHDSTVDATTDGSGTISSMTLAQIRALHITADPTLQIPTFEEYLSVCKQYGCIPIVEIKSTVPGSITACENIITVAKKYGFTEKNCIFIGSKWMIGYFKGASKTMPFIPVYQGTSYNWDTEIALVSSYINTGLDWDYTSGLTIDRAKQLHDMKMIYGTFTVDTIAETNSAFSAGVDFVTTNTVLPTD